MKPAEKSGLKEIFVLDDDRIVRDTLRMILERAGYQVTFFADGMALRDAVRHRSPGCVLLDVQLPGRSGSEILNDLAPYQVPVIMISGFANIPLAVQAIKSGAIDFIQKPFTSNDILSRVGDALAYSRCKNTFPEGFELTRREKEVLEHISDGLTSKESALAIGISHRTVEDHRQNLLRKFGVRNSTELMIAVLKLQIVKR